MTVDTNTIVVTRHTALVYYLQEIGVIDYIQDPDMERPGVRVGPVVQHATPDNVRGKHVIGVLPLHLAALAASVTEIPMDIPAEYRGRELTIEDVRRFARPPVTYRVTVLK